MKNAVAVSAPTLPGLMPNVEVLRLAESFVVRSDDGNRPMIDRFPTVLERQMLSRRFSEVERALCPISADAQATLPDGTRSSDRRLAAMALGKMFMGWGIASGRDAAERVAAFLEHLGNHPLFAIEEACRDATSRRLTKPNGEPVDFTYPPTSTMLGSAASRHAGRLFGEKLKIERVLYTKKTIPPEPSAEDRAKMKDKFEQLSRGLQRLIDVEDEETAARRDELTRAKLEREHRHREQSWRALGYEPMLNPDGTLSTPSMLQSLRRWPPKGAVKVKRAAQR